MRKRARLLYLRARDYGIRGLETRHKAFGTALRAQPKAAVMRCDKRDVPFLYWTAAAWGSAISVSKESPDLIADQSIVEALVDRAATLDADFSDGAIQQFLITYEPARPAAAETTKSAASRTSTAPSKSPVGSKPAPTFRTPNPFAFQSESLAV